MQHLPNELSESFLFHIWDSGHLRLDQLKTTNGERIEILFKGRWNLDTGPDFKDALLKIDGKLNKGDIEIHLNERDWMAHQHHQDERYNNVILHAILSKSESGQPVKTKEGKTIPTLILGNFFDESVSRLQSRFYSKSESIKKSWPQVCILSTKPKQRIITILENWGIERLRLKKERFREERDFFQFNDLLYQGICEALGYSKNREPFLKLSLILPLQIIWEIINQNQTTNEEILLKLQGLLFGTSGILANAEQNIQKLPTDITQFIQRLRFYWLATKEKYPLSEMQFIDWQFFRLRPMNFPTIRIAGLCKLLISNRNIGLLDPLLATFRDLKSTPNKIFSELQSRFIVESYGFWKNHFHLEETGFVNSRRDFHLIGKSKSREIVINVVLPVVWAYAEESEDFELIDLVKIVYQNSPKLENYYIIRKMNSQLKLDEKNSLVVPLTASHQQGMIHLAKMFCPQWHCQACVQTKK